MIKFREFKAKELQEPPRVFIAFGDAFQTSEALKKIKAYLTEQFPDIQHEKVSHPEGTFANALEKLTVFGLFGEKRCIEYVSEKELLKGSGKDFNEQEALQNLEIDSENENFLLLRLPKINKSKFLDAIDNKFFLVDCSIEKLKKSELKTIIVNQATDRGLKLSQEGAYALIDRMGDSLNQCEQALTLMELSNDAEQFWGREQVEQFFVEELQNGVFDLTDALAELNLKKSLHLIGWFLNRGTQVVELIGVMRAQFRRILFLKENINKWSEREGIQNLALPPFLYKKTLKQSEKFNLQKLKKIYTELYLLDKNCKSSKSSDKDLMEMFILRLFFNQ